MGQPQTKEEVFLAQNAAGSNGATTDIGDIGKHLHTHNIMTTILTLTLIIIVLYIGCKQYAKCQRSWMQQEIFRNNFRSFRESWRTRRPGPSGVIAGGGHPETAEMAV